jgi:hypothetical protein
VVPGDLLGEPNPEHRAKLAGSEVPHLITPYRFETKKGERHRIVQIRQVHRERMGKSICHHFVVKTDGERYFHIVFDAGELTWRMIQEVEEELFFNE